MSCLCKKEYFKLSDFVIDPATDVPVKIMNAIYEYHFKPANKARRKIGIPLFVSKSSCYRSKSWEYSRGRSGESAHTFDHTGRPGNEKGACDLTCSDLSKLLDALISETKYTRIVYYPAHNFFHVDYCYPDRGRRFFISESGKWEQITPENLKKML